MNADIQSQLAPPGAGLPELERFIGGLMFRFRRFTGSRESTNVRFQNERAAIRALVEGMPESTRGKRVLIKRPHGLEDSSRFWSVWMTLDHLRIVNGQISRVITALCGGVIPPGKVSTAAVKPDESADASVVQAFEYSCDEILSAVAAAPDLKTSVRYAHPWFGPLDAAAWHTLAAGHMGIHRVQIERIRDGLKQQKN